MEIKIKAIKEREQGKHSIMSDKDKWYNDLTFNDKLKVGEIVFLEKNKVKSLKQLEEKKDLKEVDKRIEEDVGFALDLFRDTFEREPSGQEFILLDTIIKLRREK